MNEKSATRPRKTSKRTLDPTHRLAINVDVPLITRANAVPNRQVHARPRRHIDVPNESRNVGPHIEVLVQRRNVGVPFLGHGTTNVLLATTPRGLVKVEGTVGPVALFVEFDFENVEAVRDHETARGPGNVPGDAGEDGEVGLGLEVNVLVEVGSRDDVFEFALAAVRDGGAADEDAVEPDVVFVACNVRAKRVGKKEQEEKDCQQSVGQRRQVIKSTLGRLFFARLKVRYPPEQP